MQLMKKILVLFAFMSLAHMETNAQSDSAMVKELQAFSGGIAHQFWVPKEELSKIRTEMFFVIFHIRDSAINGIEVFAKTDTLLKKYVEQYLNSTMMARKFKHVSDHDYVVPLVIKNSYPPQAVRDTLYEYLLWRKGKVKSPNKLEMMYSFPLFLGLSSAPNQR